MSRWPDVAIRRVARLGSGHTPSRQHPEYWEKCDIPWLTLADVGQLRDGTLSVVTETKEMISDLGVANSSAEVHPAGTVVLSRTASVGFSCILGRDMATSQDFATWTCGPRLFPEYLLYALRGQPQEIDSRKMGSTHKTIYMPDIETLRVPLPSVKDQRVIVARLDAETARIDGLIVKKRRMIELATERLAILVRSCISESGAPMPLKRRWRVIDCKHRTPIYVDAGYPVVSPGDVTPGLLDLGRCHRFVDETDFLDLTEGRRPRPGDIIYSRNASIGIASYVATDTAFTMGQDVCLISSPDQDQRFLTYALNSLGQDQLEEAKIGSTFSRVNIAQIKELLIPTPHPEGQRHIADDLDEHTQRADLLVRLLERQINLLGMRRQALITAAVTGALEIPGVAA